MSRIYDTTPLEERVWLSCPGCGESSTGLDERINTTTDELEFRAECDCGWAGPWRATLDDARKAWNTRMGVLTYFADNPQDREATYLDEDDPAWN